MLNNVKSRYILGIIFSYLKRKAKEKIVKYNKKLLERLNMSLEDYKEYEILEEFNTKYKTNFKEFDIKTLILSYKNFQNEGIEFLSKLHFKELKILGLSWNNIINIDNLSNAKFEKLIKLNLQVNEISNINVLEKFNFKDLKELYLGCNYIKDIIRKS